MHFINTSDLPTKECHLSCTNMNEGCLANKHFIQHDAKLQWQRFMRRWCRERDNRGNNYTYCPVIDA